MPGRHDEFVRILALREQYQDRYRETKDPIADDRLLWRAQSIRHIVHLLPGQAILELGCGSGRLTRQLGRVTRGQNPIVAVTFAPDAPRPTDMPRSVEFVATRVLPGALRDQQFDLVVGMDLLDRRNCGWVMQQVQDLLRPGGQVVFYESNPWNIFLKMRHAIARFVGDGDPRDLLGRPELYELMSELGFVRVFAVYNDFIFRPLTRPLAWVLRNLSVLLENMPVARTLAGSILLHAQRPPRLLDRPCVSLFEHESLRGAVSVVIPCHNEEMNVAPLVGRLKELFGEYLHEIILVDDNSRDGTRTAIERLTLEDPLVKPIFRSPPNGVGGAIMDGYRAATGRYVLSMDCDFQHLLPEVRDLFDAAEEGFDVVVGSRFSRHSVLLNYPFQKIIANRGFHLLARLVLRRHFRDLTNNLKLMRREVVVRLQLREAEFAVNAETGLQPLLMGFRVKEVPISWINRTPDMGTSSFRLVRVGNGYWRVLYQLWLRSVLGVGRYKDLVEVGDCRDTWRDEGLRPPKVDADGARASGDRESGPAVARKSPE